MATVLFFGGILNVQDPILHLQLYFWLWVLILIFAGFFWLGWYYAGWKPYTPLHGLYYAWKAGSNAAFIFDAPLHGEMVAERIAKCIFDYSTWDYTVPLSGVPLFGGIINRVHNFFFYYPTAFLENITPLQGLVYKFGKVNKDVEIARHLQNGEWDRSPSVNCGGVDVDIMVDTDNWTIKNSPQHKAIEETAMAWNEVNPTDQIHSYTKFQRYLIEKKIICLEVRQEFAVDWTRIDKGFTTNMESSEYVGKKIQMAEKEYSEDQIIKNRLAWYVLIGSIGLSVLIVLSRVAIRLFG